MKVFGYNGFFERLALELAVYRLPNMQNCHFGDFLALEEVLTKNVIFQQTIWLINIYTFPENSATWKSN